MCKAQSYCIDYSLCDVSLEALKMNTPSDVPCTDNVAYDTVERTVTSLEQGTVTCSDNIAYASVNNMEEDTENTNISHRAVYEEVQLKK